MNWTMPVVVSDDFIEATPGLHPVIRQYFWNRGITDPDYIDAMLNGEVLHDTNPHIMKDMYRANARTWQAIQERKPVVIYGDYDADGKTATALLSLALEKLGGVVVWYVPHRSVGYGMKPGPVEKLREENPDSDLIITVDNGIKATAAISRANDLGFDVIVTDHHSIDHSDFPHDAFAVVNPQQDDCPYHEANLCGAAVAYKFVHGMTLYALENGIHIEGVGSVDDALVFADQWVGYAALGTIGDMMPLASLENRHIVLKGMKKLRENPSPGIEELAISPARRYPVEFSEASAVDLAFSLIPYINAASRMDHPMWAVMLLRARDRVEAKEYARKLIELNDMRKEIQQEYLDIAATVMNEQDTSFAAMPMVMLQLQGCPKGLVGLVAGSLNRIFNRPVAVMTDEESGEGCWTASARSVVGLNIAQALRECDDLLVSHGGHEMAAGFTVHERNLGEFIERMHSVALRELTEDYDSPELVVDVDIPLAHVDWNLLRVVACLEPFSTVDWQPVRFVTCDVEPIGAQRWSNSKKHLRMEVYDGRGNLLKANGWNLGYWADDMPERIDLVYALEVAQWDTENFGRPYLRLAVESIRPSENSLLKDSAKSVNTEKLRKALGSGKRRRV